MKSKSLTTTFRFSRLPLCKPSTQHPNICSRCQGLRQQRPPVLRLPGAPVTLNVFTLMCPDTYHKQRLKPPPIILITHQAPNTLCAYSRQLCNGPTPRHTPNHPAAHAALLLADTVTETLRKVQLPGATGSGPVLLSLLLCCRTPRTWRSHALCAHLPLQEAHPRWWEVEFPKLHLASGAARLPALMMPTERCPPPACPLHPQRRVLRAGTVGPTDSDPLQ